MTIRLLNQMLVFIVVSLMLVNCSHPASNNENPLSAGAMNYCMKLALKNVGIEDDTLRMFDSSGNEKFVRRCVRIEPYMNKDLELGLKLKSRFVDLNFVIVKPDFNKLKIFENWSIINELPFDADGRLSFSEVISFSDVWVSQDSSTVCFALKEYNSSGRCYLFCFRKNEKLYYCVERKLLWVT